MDKFSEMDKFENINNSQLEQIDGGIASIFIGAGIVAFLGSGAAAGYHFARKYGK